MQLTLKKPLVLYTFWLTWPGCFSWRISRVGLEDPLQNLGLCGEGSGTNICMYIFYFNRLYILYNKF